MGADPRTGCVVVAAGRGERLGAGRPKALVPLAGRPLLAWALDGVVGSGCVDDVVVVCPEGAEAAVRAIVAADSAGSAGSAGSTGSTGSTPAAVVCGGATRQASVAAGLAALAPSVEVVLVHDAARALTPGRVFCSVAEAVRAGHDAVVPAVPVTDTLRSVDGGHVDRSEVLAVQTPQGFSRQALAAAHALAPERLAAATDDAGLAEAAGFAVLVVHGDEEAFKVTRPVDLLLAESLLARRAGAALGGTP